MMQKVGENEYGQLYREYVMIFMLGSLCEAALYFLHYLIINLDSPAGLAGLFFISFKLCETLCDGCQQHFTGAAVDIDQAFS